MAGLTLLDLILLAVIGLGVWRGMRTGALGQVVGTIGLLVAFWVGAALMQPVGEVVVASVGASERLAPVLGFIATFVAVLAGLMAVSHLLRKTLAALKLGFVDQTAGAVFGGLRAALGLSLFLLVTSSFALPGRDALLFGDETREESLLYGPVQALAPAAWELVRQAAPGLQARLLDKFHGDGGQEQEG